MMERDDWLGKDRMGRWVGGEDEHIITADTEDHKSSGPDLTPFGDFCPPHRKKKKKKKQTRSKHY